MKHFLHRMGVLALKIAIPCIVLLGTCIYFDVFSSRYILVQAYGELCILWHRVPVEILAGDARLSPEQQEKLVLIGEIKKFARENLGLNVGNTYTQVSFAEHQRVYTITAAYRDRLELYSWWFPIVGEVTYKGFFLRSDAEKAGARLEQDGYDVGIGRAGAFSTLGYFNDPIFLHMLDWSEYTLAKTLFHELCHATVFMKGNTVFNESLATFVGVDGAFMYLESKYGKNSPQYVRAKQKKSDQEKFAEYINRMCGDLEKLFGSELSREEKLAGREKIYTEYQEKYSGLGLKTDTFDYFTGIDLNNAKILGIRQYKRDLHVFRDLLRIYEGNMSEMINHLGTWVAYLENKKQGEKDIFKYMELVINEHR